MSFQNESRSASSFFQVQNSYLVPVNQEEATCAGQSARRHVCAKRENQQQQMGGCSTVPEIPADLVLPGDQV